MEWPDCTRHPVRGAKPAPACASRCNRCCGSGFSGELLAFVADRKSSRLKPLLQEQGKGSRLPPLLPGSKRRLLFAVALALDLRGPSVAAGAADPTRRAPHMDVRRFPRGQDAPPENPAGSANPMRTIGRAGWVCFLFARFLCTSKERWLAPSRRESSRS